MNKLSKDHELALAAQRRAVANPAEYLTGASTSPSAQFNTIGVIPS